MQKIYFQHLKYTFHSDILLNIKTKGNNMSKLIAHNKIASFSSLKFRVMAICAIISIIISIIIIP